MIDLTINEEQLDRTVEDLDQQWFEDRYWDGFHQQVPDIDELIREFNRKVGLSV